MSKNAAPDYITLADRIEQDVRDKGLKPGDRYLGTVEVARHWHVGTASANRALQLLERRRVLRRRQRIGTVVDQPRKAPASIATVHIVVPREAVESEGLFRDGTLMGL